MTDHPGPLSRGKATEDGFDFQPSPQKLSLQCRGIDLFRFLAFVDLPIVVVAMNSPLLLTLFTFLVVFHASPALLGDEISVSKSEEFLRALRAAKPGDVVRLAPGKYRGGLSYSGLSGSKDRPLIITGADTKDPPVIEGGGSGLHLRSPQHVILQDLIFTGAAGNGLNIDDGGDAAAPAHDLTLKNIVIENVGPLGNSDGIKLSGVDDFKIEKCRVEKWGASGSAIDMVGCHRGEVTDGTFASARGEAANGVQTKGGSSEITISRCRFLGSGGRGVNCGGSTGLDYFRPKDAVHEAKAITIEDCTFAGGMAAIAFVGVDGAIARHNTIYCPTKWVIRILQENNGARFARCSNVKFEQNLIAFRSTEVAAALNVGANTSPETFSFSQNAWCCLDRPGAAQRVVRLPSKETAGVYDFAPVFKDAEKGDLTLEKPAPQQAGVRP